MARTDAVQFFLELAAEWRRLGAEVTFEPGWEKRGNGTSPAYEGGIVHHTGFVSSVANPFPARNTLLNGRPDLPGPLCNVAGPVCPAEKPRLHVVAAFPANHAGASGGRSMGPLPKSSLFNRLVVGLEIDYAGLTPMIGGQHRASLIFTRGLANVLARSVEYIRAHEETSITGKWDIGVGNGRVQTYDMAAFRRDAANLSPSAPPSLPLGDTEMKFAQTPDGTIWKITDYDVRPEGNIYRYGALAKARGVTDAVKLTAEELRDNQADAAALRAGLLTDFAKAAGGDVDEAAIVAGLLPKLSEALSKLPAAGSSFTLADVEQAVRSVFADAAKS